VSDKAGLRIELRKTVGATEDEAALGTMGRLSYETQECPYYERRVLTRDSQGL